jgi:hypothetical protein
MDLIEYFERQKQRCELELKYADAPGFQLFERTPQGEQDISEQHIQQLRQARDEDQWMIEHLESAPTDSALSGGAVKDGMAFSFFSDLHRFH